MEFTNNTGQVLKLVSASRGGDSAHWEKQAPATLGVGEEGFASSYSASSAQINLTYQGVDDNVTFTLFGETPLAGSNKASGSATSSSYTVDASAGPATPRTRVQPPSKPAAATASVLADAASASAIVSATAETV